MTFNSIRIGDTASETYLISKYYDDAIKDCNETFITTHFQKDGTMFLFIYKNGVSEEDIISFNSKPLECYKSKLPSGIQLLTMMGPIEATMLIGEKIHTLNALLKEENEKLYMVLVDTKTDKIVVLRNAELPYCVRKGIFHCGKSVVRTGITDSKKLKKAVETEIALLEAKKIAPHITYLGQEIQNNFPDIDIFISI